ncbi:hypothetical protein CBS101457_006358 [Exobasidium rhododendri]|nr:hypothetical protein CBS101457_006358 [Exobasidium rhododendri]
MRGALIVVEGLDRAGKSTQVAKLAADLSCKVIKFPDRQTAIGVMIDSYLSQKSDVDDRAIHLLFSANRWEASRSILEQLGRGVNIICDRYAFSGIAYSCAKGLEYEWCRAPDIGLPSPDLTIFLHLSPEIAAKRGGYGDERYENLAMQTKVRECFAKIGQDMAGRHWHAIDAGRGVEEVAADCTKAAMEAIRVVGESGAAVGRLFV